LKGENLTENVNFRLTVKERSQLSEQAEIAGLTVSEYVRRRICGVSVPSKIEKRMLSELRRQGGLLKFIFNESHGMYSEKVDNTLTSINSFIQNLERRIFDD